MMKIKRRGNKTYGIKLSKKDRMRVLPSALMKPEPVRGEVGGV